MAVKKKSNSGIRLNGDVIEKVNAAIADMLEKHADEIETTVSESETSKAGVSFSMELDCSESAPTVTVKFRATTAITDSRKLTFPDPNQPSLFTMTTPEEEKARLEKEKAKADKKKPKKDAEASED